MAVRAKSVNLTLLLATQDERERRQVRKLAPSRDSDAEEG